MINKSKIIELVEEKLSPEQFLVDVSVSSGNVIHVEIDSEQGITISKCVEVSRHIEGSLDREEEDFELQVSSAGLGQAFKVYRQYLKSLEQEIEVTTRDGQKFRGVLTEVNEQGIEIESVSREKVEGSKKKELVTRTLRFEFDTIKEAKRIIKF